MGGCVSSSQSESNKQNIKYISHSTLANVMQIQSKSNVQLNDYLIIDLRDELIDHNGGHIGACINISDTLFPQKMCGVFIKYNAKKKLILYDMYGVQRSILCFQQYLNYKKQIISNYCTKTQTSYYYIYNKQRVDINNCNDEMIANLSKQQVFVLNGGFFELINSSYSNIIVDFDESMWEKLEIAEDKRWYHKNEYFATAATANSVEVKHNGFACNHHQIAFLNGSQYMLKIKS